MTEAIAAVMNSDPGLMATIMRNAGEDEKQVQRYVRAIENKQAMDEAAAKVQNQWH